MKKALVLAICSWVFGGILVIQPVFGQTVSASIELTNASIADLQAAFQKGILTAEKLVGLYLTRIDTYDKEGPRINSVIALNSRALAEARELDAERKAGKIRGPLHGIPFSLKDNINTVELPTTAGSCLLAGSIPAEGVWRVQAILRS
jgi:amidase